MKLDQNQIAEQLLQHTALSADDVARLVLELLESPTLASQLDQLSKVETMEQCRSVINKGLEQHARSQQTLPFYRAVQEHIRTKLGRRSRTINEIQHYANRVIRMYPTVKECPMSQFTRELCQDITDKCFERPNARRKAVNLFKGLFNFGIKRGLCVDNPFGLVDVPKATEVRIQTLTIKQIRRLIDTAKMEEHRACAPALGLMLWAGIRPNELERLTWGNIHIRARLIEIEPQHAKTGGARHVHMQAILIKWLRTVCQFTPSTAPITPKAWSRRWKSLRQAAGFKTWQADTLRHTFASYHLAYFKDLNALQLEMGHANSNLLRTRYLSMAGITPEASKQFWGK